MVLVFVPSDTDTGVQSEDLKNKLASHWSYIDLSPKPGDPASRNLRMRLSLRAVSPCLIFQFRAGPKDAVGKWYVSCQLYFR